MPLRYIVLIMWMLAGAQTLSATPMPTPAEYAVAEPPVLATNLWFDVGEEIIYNIYWGVIYVGHSHVTTDWIAYRDGRTLLRIRFQSRSNKVLAAIYPVEDYQEALIDPVTFLPVSYTKISRQGSRHYHEVTTFDHAERKARWACFIKNKQMDIDIDPDTRDIISIMYLIRNMDYGVGSAMQMKVYTEEKLYDLHLNVKRRESVKLDKYGKVPSLEFHPEAVFDGLFVRKGNVHVWVSDDDRRLCTKIVAQVPVAKIRIQIAEVKGPGNDFWVGKPVAPSASSGASASTLMRVR